MRSEGINVLNNSNVKEQVIEIIARVLELKRDEVTDELSIGDVPKWDSIGNMAILTTLESELGIDFPADDLFEMTSVQSILSEIEKLVGSNV